MNKLRLGVILSDINVPVWVARMLEQIKNSDHAEVTALAFTEEAPNQASPLYERYFQLDRRIFRTLPSPWEQKDVRQILHNTQLSGQSFHERVSRFKSMRLDVILNLGLEDIPASILDTARFGVWSLRCNDARIVTGTEFGWRELLEDEPLLRCVLEAQRKESIHAVAGSALAAHPNSFTQNQRAFLWRASALVPRALRDLHTNGESGFFAEAETLEPARKISLPVNAQIVSLAWKQVLGMVENNVWRRWFPHRWGLVSGIRAEGEKLSLKGLRLKVPPRGVYWVDPFLIQRQGKSYVYFEEFVYKTGLGRIAFAMIQQDGSIGVARTALERPYHLSYPFLFEHRGEFYMIPETGQNRSIEVYRCTRFPDQWAYHKTLMQNVRAVDATLFEHLAQWWMFVNIAGEGGSTWDELHLFYADDPLSEQWTPHPLNPIVSDVRSARPAGRIFRRGSLILRPSQDSSNRYGYALNLNRITKLTRSEYEEELLERLEPGNDFLAAHTFNSMNELTVMDVLMKKG